MKKKLREFSFMIIGVILYSLCVSVFLVPNKIGTGGITGISLGLNVLFNFPIGISTLILNIPLFIFGYNFLGRSFVIKSSLAVVFSSLLIDYLNIYFPFNPLGDTLTSSIFAGITSGLGMALLFMSGSSTGGLDISAKIINCKFKSLELSKILLVQDIFVYIFIAVTLGPKSVMYALIMSFVRSKTIDAIQEGIASSRQCIIICENPDKIIEAIEVKLGRGVTLLNAEGCYSHTTKKFIYVVIQKVQLKSLKSIVTALDPKAFVTVSSVKDIQGNFKQKSLSV